MSYTVTKKTLDETPFLFIRRQVKPESIAEALGEIFPSVFQHATEKGLPFAGPPTTRYPHFGPGLITLEAGMPIAGPGEGAGEIELGTLVGGAVATTIHKGPYDDLGQGHDAIQAWIAENGEEAGGAPWEAYLTDPGEVPDPADWLTEISWPLKER
ncbi:MAG: GyrI-like domain-containing protein [Holophagales bacterium]|nr:GyrI-like domain-containing protein [Holophagales bacterium]